SAPCVEHSLVGRHQSANTQLHRESAQMTRSLLCAPVAAVLFATVACVRSEQPTSVRMAAAPPLFSSGTVDTSALPDLIVDSKATQNNWLVRVEDLPADFCSVIEGGVSPGTHTIIRFTVTTPNIGAGDVFVGSPLKHMDPNGDGNFSDADGLFEFAQCHQHFHFQHYATYRLLDSRG